MPGDYALHGTPAAAALALTLILTCSGEAAAQAGAAAAPAKSAVWRGDMLPRPGADGPSRASEPVLPRDSTLPAQLPAITRIMLEPARTLLEGHGVPATMVDVSEAGVKLGSARVDAMGRWLLLIDRPLSAGDHRIQAVARDAGGVLGQGAEVQLSIPEGFHGQALLVHRTATGGDQQAAQAAADARRRHMEEMASAASEKFDEVLRTPQWQRLAQLSQGKAGGSPPAPPVSARQAEQDPLAAVHGWFDRASRDYQDSVVKRLADPRPMATMPSEPRRPASPAPGSPVRTVTEAPLAPLGQAAPAPRSQPQPPARHATWLESWQDWLGKAGQEYSGNVVGKLAQPQTPTPPPSPSAGGDARQAEALRKADAERREAEARRDAEQRRLAELKAAEARRLAELKAQEAIRAPAPVIGQPAGEDRAQAELRRLEEERRMAEARRADEERRAAELRAEAQRRQAAEEEQRRLAERTKDSRDEQARAEQARAEKQRQEQQRQEQQRQEQLRLEQARAEEARRAQEAALAQRRAQDLQERQRQAALAAAEEARRKEEQRRAAQQRPAATETPTAVSPSAPRYGGFRSQEEYLQALSEAARAPKAQSDSRPPAGERATEAARLEASRREQARPAPERSATTPVERRLPPGFASEADYRRALEEAARAPKAAPPPTLTSRGEATQRREAEARARELLRSEAQRVAELKTEKERRTGDRRLDEELRRAAQAPKVYPEGSGTRGPVGTPDTGRSNLGAGRPEPAPRPRSDRPVAECPAAGRRVSLPGTYVVRSGDTLWQIADRFYGDGEAYRRIVRANKGKIDDPDDIEPCMRLVLPGRTRR